MSNKLVIAQYGNKLIGVKDYQESLHKGKIICPFCFDLNKNLKVKFDKRGYFAAWPKAGGHICGKGCLEYFNSEWEGRRLVETALDKDQNMEVTIDLFSAFSHRIGNSEGNNLLNHNYKENYKQYNRYIVEKKVFRDVVRTVKQMKKIIENNNMQTLEKIKFSYKTSPDETISIKELIKSPDELSPQLSNKNRFVVCKVENIRQKICNGKTTSYINAYSTNNTEFTIVYKCASDKGFFNKLRNNYAIGYGKINKDREQNKYYLEIANDFNVMQLEDSAAEMFFNGKQLNGFDIEKYKQNKSNNKFTQNHINIISNLENCNSINVHNEHNSTEENCKKVSTLIDKKDSAVNDKKIGIKLEENNKKANKENKLKHLINLLKKYMNLT